MPPEASEPLEPGMVSAGGILEDAPDRIAVFGGVYNNHLALAAAVEDARARGAKALYCLGDLGGFGPHPDRVFPILREAGVRVVRGNYDDSVARGFDDCQCGYTDPRDNHFARISYRYTFRNTSARWRRWMADLPAARRVRLGSSRVLMCHGSPRRMNEFLWESTTPTHFLDWLAKRHRADVILATHTGIPWQRPLSLGGLFANVGVLGRPANDGRTDVWYALLTARRPAADGDRRAASDGDRRAASDGDRRARADGTPAASPEVEFVPVAYDHERLAADMRAEELPEEFVETILTGWWTTCLEVLPMKERRRGRF